MDVQDGPIVCAPPPCPAEKILHPLPSCPISRNLKKKEKKRKESIYIYIYI